MPNLKRKAYRGAGMEGPLCAMVYATKRYGRFPSVRSDFPQKITRPAPGLLGLAPGDQGPPNIHNPSAARGITGGFMRNGEFAKPFSVEKSADGFEVLVLAKILV